MIIRYIIIAFCSFSFIMIGVDKFMPFLDPPCSLAGSISPVVWKVIGVLQLTAGILIWFPKYIKLVTGFFTAFMLVFSVVHLVNGTSDIGGAATMAVLLGLLFWNPSFLQKKKKESATT